MMMYENEKSQDKNDVKQHQQQDATEKHQDLAKENLGNEPEEQPEGNPDSPHRLTSLEDKRPDDDSIKKGWSIDSDTSRGPQDEDLQS
jgi:hypothetical protein